MQRRIGQMNLCRGVDGGHTERVLYIDVTVVGASKEVKKYSKPP